MRIVFLDCEYVNPGDLKWDAFKELGFFKNHRNSTPEEGRERIADADIVMVDKFVMDKAAMDAAPNLKLICCAATGYNNIDLEYAKEKGIAVTNVPAYSADAVSQLAFALLLEVTNKADALCDMVRNRQWVSSRHSAYGVHRQILLAGKSIGIVGYGNIGKRVAEIARAFGMTVNIYSQDPEAAIKSDVVSLHCPLTAENAKMVNEEFISQMKDGAILINTSRGGLVDEAALINALKRGKLYGVGLDVMAEEPATKSSELFSIPNVIITPHIGFSPAEARGTILRVVMDNINSFLEGGALIRIV
ncbi:MAG: D-2-hydroxyacid dehydrogenase [Eubacterium sp.]|nr:D-2-hydroxyacid dehydrogenase [Candidatus Colimonas fimequi]